jgi:hypothetical protein
VDWIADTKNLRIAYEYLAREGGEAPGPDGLTYTDLCDEEVWRLLRALSPQIKEGTYQRGQTGTVRISKGYGRGTRCLSLPIIWDRVVGRAAAQILTLPWAPQFDEHSFCRDRQSHLDALATANVLRRREERSLWIADDIRGAFDNVPVGRLLDVVRNRTPDDRLVGLIARLVARPEGKGLRQGCPLSPLLMNLYLDHFLDRPWREHHGSVPLLRYIDDLLILCRKDENGLSLYQSMRQLLANSGLQLKGSPEEAIRDLAQGARVPWLGFGITGTDGDLQLRLDRSESPGGLASDLRDKLLRLHRKPDAPLRAWQAIKNLVSQAGPCYPHTDRKRFYAVVARVAHEAAFDEIPDFKAIEQCWSAAHGRWRRLLDAIAAKYDERRLQKAK